MSENERLEEAHAKIEPALRSFLSRRVRRNIRDPDVEDILQDTFVRVLRQLRRERKSNEVLDVAAWLINDSNHETDGLEALRQITFCCAKWVILDRHKQRQRDCVVADLAAIASVSSDAHDRESATIRDRAELIESLFRMATDGERHIFELTMQNWSHRGIALVCRVHPSTVSRRLRHFKDRLPCTE